MRWFWRASLLPVVLDGLLEGSLVGVAYLALALGGPGSSAPLLLVEFWLAAGIGLVASRWRSPRLSRLDAARVIALLAGLVGWLADPAARDALLALRDPLAALPIHPAGWLLGIAVLRGAVHEKADVESEVATRAIIYAFVVLTVALLLHLGAGGDFVVNAVIGSAVCVCAGLFAIGHARMRELEALGSVTRSGRTWPALATGVVVVAALAIPFAFLAVTTGRELMSGMSGPFQEAIGALSHLLGEVWGWLQSVIAHFLNGPGMPLPKPSPTPSPTPTVLRPPLPTPGSVNPSLPSMSTLGTVARVALVVIAIMLVIRFRRFIPRRIAAPPAPVLSEERHAEPHRPKFGVRIPRPRLPARLQIRRKPTSAVEAYVALLDELADKGELGRRPAETPRSHAERAGKLGLPRLPLGLLAADYELAVYGRAAISEQETKRALGRWQRLRKLARQLPRTSPPDNPAR
ncbi:MAG TPA: DUF4129 domain-containing protein [Candidatus Limnocylindrales bacterium]